MIWLWRPCLILFLCCPFLVQAKTYTDKEGRDVWAAYKQKPITETSFRQVCDLIQDIGQTNISLSYQILSEYLPMVKATHNRGWAHVLLMAWAKAKESLTFFPEAEALYRQARDNAGTGTRMQREALVGTVLMYLEWGRPDSLDKYLAEGEAACIGGNDSENLSFIYTFKALGHIQDTAALRRNLLKAIDLALDLPNKNALFTARYNYAVICCASNPQAQVNQLDACLALAADSTLSHKPRLYERSAFYFRNPSPSVYYQLMQVNLLLADYTSAGRFADMFYEATVKPRPGNPQVPYFDSEMAIVKMYQGDVPAARTYLAESLRLFGVPEDSLTYVSYFIAAGLLAEHDGDVSKALQYYEKASQSGSTEGLHVMPPGIYYAHALILAGSLAKAQDELFKYLPELPVREYSAYGFYYYQTYAELLKAKGDYKGYAGALETYNVIKDSLASLSRYRAIQEVETKMKVRDKEAQITLLHQESLDRLQRLHRDRIYFIVLSGLSVSMLLLLVAYTRNLVQRKRQADQIARQKEILQQHQLRQLDKQYQIDTMQRVIHAEENERRKIADRLHDEVGAELALASLNISSSIEQGRVDPKLEKAREMISTVSGTIRDLSHRLTPLVIEQYGFRKAIEDLAYSVNISEKIQLETVIVGFTGADRYPITFLNDLYRIIQELLHNVLKHAQATHALLEIVEHDRLLSLLVEDNGKGIPGNAVGLGKGLSTIQSRIAYLGGKIEIQAGAEGGTIILIEINTDNDDAHQTDHSG